MYRSEIATTKPAPTKGRTKGKAMQENTLTPAARINEEQRNALEGAIMRIPDFAEEANPRTMWPAEAYGEVLEGYVLAKDADKENPELHRIKKLAKSAVAPLVAAARGYRTATKENRDSLKGMFGIDGGFHQGRGHMFGKATTHSAALTMPWYSITAVGTAQRTGCRLDTTSYQARPEIAPVDEKTGKEKKYLLPQGDEVVVGCHPATPEVYIFEATVVLIAEGLIKADSALTAQLRPYATHEELSQTLGGDVDKARAALTEIMGRIPAADRVLIVEIVGCWSWTGKGPWMDLQLKGRNVWIGLDADVKSKLNVWQAGRALNDYMKQKNAKSVQFLELPLTETSNGLDDMFAEGGAVFSDLATMLGDLPPQPELRGYQRSSNRPLVNLEDGVTFEVKERKLKDGSVELYQSAIAEMAVQIDKVTVLRSATPGSVISTEVAGRTSWIERDEIDNHLGVRHTTFSGVPFETLAGNSRNIIDLQNTLSDGDGSGAWIATPDQPRTLDAWRATAGATKTRETELDSAGVWVHNGEIFWVTSYGSIHANRFEESFHCKVRGHAPYDIPYIDYKVDAKELTDAHEEYWALHDEYHPAMNALFPAKVGAILALAVGVHPRGLIAVATDLDSGKSTAVACEMTIYGAGWGTQTHLKLETTVSAMRKRFGVSNNVMLSIDDARELDDMVDIKTMKKIVDSVIRESYEPESRHRKSVQSKNGWVAEAFRKDSLRIGTISAEDIELLGLTGSSVSRIISWTVDTTKKETLLARRGTIAPKLKSLIKSNNASKTLGAFIVKNLRNAEGGETEAELREGIASRVNELVEFHNGEMMQMDNCPGERARDFITPVVAALHAYAEMIADAYTVQGRHAAAERVMATVESDRANIIAAYHRHRELYGAKAEKVKSTGVVASILAAIASNQAALHYDLPVGSSTTPVGRRFDNGDYFLVPEMVLQLLQRMGQKNATDETVRFALKQIGTSKTKRVGAAGKMDLVRGWYITAEKWDEARGTSWSKTITEEEVDADELDDDELEAEDNLIQFGEIQRDGVTGRLAA